MLRSGLGFVLVFVLASPSCRGGRAPSAARPSAGAPFWCHPASTYFSSRCYRVADACTSNGTGQTCAPADEAWCMEGIDGELCYMATDCQRAQRWAEERGEQIVRSCAHTVADPAPAASDSPRGWWCDLDEATPPCIREMEACNAYAEGTCAWRETAYCFDHDTDSGQLEQFCTTSHEACTTQEEFDAHAYPITSPCRASW